jgi:major type 1 subunit fimbrin (pilin)
MKNIKLASALAIVMGLAAVGTANAADGGTITFHGVVTDSTCTVKGGAGTDGGANNFSVTLDGVPASTLAAANSTAAPKEFQVNIGGEGETACGATDNGGSVVATMTFGVSPQVNVNGSLNNIILAADGGTDAQIQLLNKDGSKIDLSKTNAGSQSATIVANQATMSYTAQYFSQAGGAKAGKLETNVVYQVAYN